MNTLLKYFRYEHLPARLQVVSAPLGDVAIKMDEALPDCAEKTAGLRKLLEAKDCFVRAALEAETPQQAAPKAVQPGGASTVVD